MKITLNVNAEEYPLDVEPRRILADVLRDDCGSPAPTSAANTASAGPARCWWTASGPACLMLAVQCDGRAVRTVEGLTGADGGQHPLQRAFSAERALQCGFCTPGFLMAGRRRAGLRPYASPSIRNASTASWAPTSAGAPATTDPAGHHARGGRAAVTVHRGPRPWVRLTGSRRAAPQASWRRARRVRSPSLGVDHLAEAPRALHALRAGHGIPGRGHYAAALAPG